MTPTPTPPAEVDVAEAIALTRAEMAEWEKRGDHCTARISLLNPILTAAEQVAGLRRALGWFVDDERFDVAVGGNPNVVEPMIAEAQRIYRSALGAAP